MSRLVAYLRPHGSVAYPAVHTFAPAKRLQTLCQMVAEADQEELGSERFLSVR